MTNVFGWMADQEACGYYRIKQPLDAVADLHPDWEVGYGRRLPIPWRQPRDGVLICQRLHMPGPLTKMMEYSREGRPRLVYEIDDNLLDVDPSNEIACTYFNHRWVRDNLIHAMGLADLTIVSTQPLADTLAKYCKQTVVIPNTIDEILLQIDATPQDKGSPVVIGWQGSQTHEKDWSVVVPALRRLARGSRPVELHTWGACYAVETLRKMLPVVHHDWQPIDQYYRSLKMDIGLAPLYPNIFNRSKSHIRVLEMAALGIPVVASNVGPYAEFVRHGETGYLVDRDHDWARYLRNLVEDPQLRREMGRAARQQATKHWTIQGSAGLWADAIQGVSND